MANYIKRIRTDDGDKQIDYEALANKPDLSKKVDKVDDYGLVNIKERVLDGQVLNGMYDVTPYGGNKIILPDVNYTVRAIDIAIGNVEKSLENIIAKYGLGGDSV